MKGEFIKMPHGGLTKLAKELGVSTVTVRSALEGINQSPKARRLGLWLSRKNVEVTLMLGLIIRILINKQWLTLQK